MNNTKLLEQLHAIIKVLPEDEQKNAEFMLKHNEKFSDLCTVASLVTDLIKDVTEDLHAAEAKASGKGAARKAAERVMKQLTNAGKVPGAFTLDGLQYVGGCYVVVRLSEPLTVTELPENVEPVNYKSVIENISQNDGVMLELPRRNDLAVYIKTEKAKHKGQKNYKCEWDFGYQLPAVDANYLLDILELLGDCTARASSRATLTSGIYFKNDKGEDGILMPIRKV